MADVASFLNDSNSDVSAATSTGGVDVTSSIDLSLSSSGSFTTATIGAGTSNGFATDANIESTLSALTNAQSTLRAQASTFGTNLSIVENRQDFTKSLINTLEEGAGKLTLADTNEEGANLLALQTQQTLASTSLSLAAQADQNVLRLF